MRAKIQKTMGQAQKQITHWEDGARRFLQGTWQQVQETRPVRRIEAAMEAIKSTYSNTMKMGGLKQRAGDLGSAYSAKAFHTVGLVTQQDLEAIEHKLNQLSKDVTKLGPRAKKTTTKKAKSVQQAKKSSKSLKKNG